MLTPTDTLEALEVDTVDTVDMEVAMEEAMEDIEVDLEVMAVKEATDGAVKTVNEKNYWTPTKNNWMLNLKTYQQLLKMHYKKNI